MNQNEILAVISMILHDIKYTKPLKTNGTFIEEVSKSLGRQLMSSEQRLVWELYSVVEDATATRTPYMGFVDIMLDKIAGMIDQINHALNETPDELEVKRFILEAKLQTARAIFDEIEKVKKE